MTDNTGPITAITVAAGTLFILQFDSTPTLIHHATNLDLPGEANITVVAGAKLLGFATAANQVDVLAYTKADGTAVVAGASSPWVKLGATSGTGQGALSVDWTNDNYTDVLVVFNVTNDTDNQITHARLRQSAADVFSGDAYYDLLAGATATSMQIVSASGTQGYEFGVRGELHVYEPAGTALNKAVRMENRSNVPVASSNLGEILGLINDNRRFHSASSGPFTGERSVTMANTDVKWGAKVPISLKFGQASLMMLCCLHDGFNG